MPCRPETEEWNYSAILLRAVLQGLGESVPPWVEDAIRSSARGGTQRAAVELCRRVRELTASQRTKLAREPGRVLDRLDDWAARHLRADARRKR